MYYGGVSTGPLELETIKIMYLELEGDELVDLVNLIVDRGRGVEPRDIDRCGIRAWPPPRRICGYGLQFLDPCWHLVVDDVGL